MKVVATALEMMCVFVQQRLAVWSVCRVMHSVFVSATFLNKMAGFARVASGGTWKVGLLKQILEQDMRLLWNKFFLLTMTFRMEIEERDSQTNDIIL